MRKSVPNEIQSCRAAPDGAGLLIRRQKSGNDYEKHVRFRAKACLRWTLAQSSRPQTVLQPAVWEQDQRLAEKWYGQGRTSRTGDAASENRSLGVQISIISVVFAVKTVTIRWQPAKAQDIPREFHSSTDICC